MPDNRLKSLAERIETLMDERDGIASDIRDIFAEAKSSGYVPKVLRKAIMRKRMDASKRDKEDAILELYEGALGAVGKAVAAVRAGSTWEEAAENEGVPRATLARAMAVSKRREQFQNDTADQITETAAGDRLGEESPATDGPGSSLSSGARQVPTGQPGNTGGINEQAHLNQSAGIKTSNNSIDESPAGGEKPVTPAGGHHAKRRLTVEPEVARVAPPALGAVGAKPRVASDNDWPEMPAGLRRVRP